MNKEKLKVTNKYITTSTAANRELDNLILFYNRQDVSLDERDAVMRLMQAKLDIDESVETLLNQAQSQKPSNKRRKK